MDKIIFRWLERQIENLWQSKKTAEWIVDVLIFMLIIACWIPIVYLLAHINGWFGLAGLVAMARSIQPEGLIIIKKAMDLLQDPL